MQVRLGLPFGNNPRKYSQGLAGAWGDALASDGIYTTEVSFWLPRPLTVAWDPPGLRHPPGHSDACRWSYEKSEDKSIPFDS